MEKKLLPLTLELQQRDQQIIDLKEELEKRHEKGDKIDNIPTRTCCTVL